MRRELERVTRETKRRRVHRSKRVSSTSGQPLRVPMSKWKRGRRGKGQRESKRERHRREEGKRLEKMVMGSEDCSEYILGSGLGSGIFSDVMQFTSYWVRLEIWWKSKKGGLEGKNDRVTYHGCKYVNWLSLSDTESRQGRRGKGDTDGVKEGVDIIGELTRRTGSEEKERWDYTKSFYQTFLRLDSYRERTNVSNLQKDNGFYFKFKKLFWTF